MTFDWHNFAPMQRTKAAAAFVGGGALIALAASGISATTTHDPAFASKTHHSDDATYSSPTEPAMSLGATTTGETEQKPSTPGPTPAIEFAAPKVKAAH